MGAPPTLVLIGGTLCDDALWQPMLRAAPELATHVRLLEYSRYRSAQDAVRDLLPGLPGRFAVAGFSLGGFLALEMLAQAPERVAGLALIATNARADAPANARARRQAAEDAEREGVAAYVRRVLWPNYVAAGRLDDDTLMSRILAMARRVGTDTFARQADIAARRADSLPRLAAVRVPTLIVSGQADVLNPADRQQEMADRIAGARWVSLPQVGHFVPLEAPVALAAAMGRWAARL